MKKICDKPTNISFRQDSGRQGDTRDALLRNVYEVSQEISRQPRESALKGSIGVCTAAGSESVLIGTQVLRRRFGNVHRRGPLCVTRSVKVIHEISHHSNPGTKLALIDSPIWSRMLQTLGRSLPRKHFSCSARPSILSVESACRWKHDRIAKSSQPLLTSIYSISHSSRLSPP